MSRGGENGPPCAGHARQALIKEVVGAMAVTETVELPRLSCSSEATKTGSCEGRISAIASDAFRRPKAMVFAGSVRDEDRPDSTIRRLRVASG